MLSNPRIGQRVVLHYRASVRPITPHGQQGTILVRGRGKPRNHLVLLDDGRKVVVPCGNINAADKT